MINSKYKTIISIDPGINGAIVILRNKNITIKKIHDLFYMNPETNEKLNTKQIKSLNDNQKRNLHLYLTDNLIEYLRYWTELGKSISFIEKVGTLNPDEVATEPYRAIQMMKLIKHYSELRSILKTLKSDVITVSPRTWIKEMNLKKIKNESDTDRKNRYKELAKTFYPEINVTLSNADALLILQFGRLKLLREPEWIENKLTKKL